MRGAAFMLGTPAIVVLVAAAAIVLGTIGFAWWEKKNGRNQ